MIVNPEDKELADVMREEKSRGKRRVDTTEQPKTRRVERGLLNAIQAGDLHAFVRILRDAGLRDESPEFANALRVFHASRPRR